MGKQTKSARIRDAMLAVPALLLIASLVSAAPPTGTVAPGGVTRHCPSEMALVGESCVDRWEASLVVMHADGSETPFSPYYSPHNFKVRAVSKPNVVPQGYISMADARRACEASKKRLCHAAEWKAACKGPDKTLWPYGDTHVPNMCTDTNRTAPLPKLYSGKAMYENKNMIDARLNQFPNTIAKTGEAPSCTNKNGVWDMVGNVNEWVDDGTLHGGFYLDTKGNGTGCDYVTAAHVPVYYDYSTGFRCCMDASDDAVQTKQNKPPVVTGKKLAKK